MSESVVDTVVDKVENVPKKYWVIGGIVLLLLFLFIRKRSMSSNSVTASTSGTEAAMQLPTGIGYYTPSSGGGGISGGSDISNTFGSNPSAVLPGTNNPIGGGTSNAPVVGNVTSGNVSYSPVSSGSKSVYYGSGTIVGGVTGDYIDDAELKSWFAANPNQSQWIAEASRRGLTGDEAALLIAKGTGGDYQSIRSQVYTTVNASGQYGFQDTGRIMSGYGVKVDTDNDGMLNWANGAGSFSAAPGTPNANPINQSPVSQAASPSAPANNRPSSAEILNFYQQNANSPAVLQAAMSQYGLSASDVAAAGVPMSAIFAPVVAPVAPTPVRQAPQAPGSIPGFQDGGSTGAGLDDGFGGYGGGNDGFGGGESA